MKMTVNGQRKQLEDWSQINWRQTRKAMRNLRQRIFRAKQLGLFRGINVTKRTENHTGRKAQNTTK